MQITKRMNRNTVQHVSRGPRDLGTCVGSVRITWRPWLLFKPKWSFVLSNNYTIRKDLSEISSFFCTYVCISRRNCIGLRFSALISCWSYLRHSAVFVRNANNKVDENDNAFKTFILFSVSLFSSHVTVKSKWVYWFFCKENNNAMKF